MWKSKSRGYVWRKVRKQYLDMVGHWCEGCGGAKAVNVHHLHQTADGGQMYDFDNLMAVCRECHDQMHDDLRRGLFDCCLEAVHEGL